MSGGQHQWDEEQQRVEAITASIVKRIAKLEAEAGAVRSEVVGIRKHFWEEVSLNISSTDDAVETYASLKQQAEVLSERERSHRQAAEHLRKLRRLRQSPYFGRIDFAEQGQRTAEAIYLGIASFVDEDENDLIYDWRAPISSLYYDYAPGPCSFAAPDSTVSGEMLLKRQFVIRDGSIRLMFDTGLTIGDELLQQALSRTSDAQMKSIVATIQQEQNRIIRNDRSRMLIVQGAAGSGKTSAALQRAAYLLYRHREHLKAEQMLLFSPNPLFNSYISTVLPELGEENILQTTFHAYLDHQLGGTFEVEDPFAQLEFVLAPESAHPQRYEARLSGIRYKSSTAFLQALQDYAVRLQKTGMRFVPLTFRGIAIISAERMYEVFYSFDAGIRLPNRMELLREWLLKEIAAYAERELDAPWVEDEIELLSAEDYRTAYRQLRKHQARKEASFDDYDAEKRLLAHMVLERHLQPLRQEVRELRFADITGLYAQLFQQEDGLFASGLRGDAPERWEEIGEQTLSLLAERKLAYEDAAPYLYVSELVKGFQTNPSIRHVLVDEAQDYTPFQLEMLKRLFPRCRMTALGDVNQAVSGHAQASIFGELEPMVALYGAEQTEVIRLTRSYRSTKEIVVFTRGMVPGGQAIAPFERSGAKPLLMEAADRAGLHEQLAADAAELLAEGYASIAIICKTAGESADAYAALEGRLPLRLVTKHSPSLEKGALVIPSYLAKGVEFDAVLVYDGSQERYGREEERKLFYTVCTRAMHTLHIYSLGAANPFIAEQPLETYERRR